MRPAPGRGFYEAVIGESQRASCGARFGNNFPLFLHHGRVTAGARGGRMIDRGMTCGDDFSSLDDSGATAVVLESEEHATRFESARTGSSAIAQVWRIDRGDLETLSDQGADITDEALEQRRSMARGDDVATLVYTSGSTGAPKGCVLTHSNFVDLSRNFAVAMKDVVAPGASTLLTPAERLGERRMCGPRGRSRTGDHRRSWQVVAELSRSGFRGARVARQAEREG